MSEKHSYRGSSIVVYEDNGQTQEVIESDSRV